MVPASVRGSKGELPQNALSEQEVHQVAQEGETDMKLRRMKLTKYEQEIERSLNSVEWVPGSKTEFDAIARAIAERNSRPNVHMGGMEGDLDALKARAKSRGVKYQTFIAEMLRRIAHS